jgi:iron complex transport system substrate-binding protein
LDFGLRKTRHISLFLLTAFVLAMLGCVQAPADSAHSEGRNREVRDDLGRIVRVPHRIERAISLAPSLTETIFAIGAGGKLVGVTTYCDYPADTAKIEKIGDTQTPNIERIIALKPHIVFVSTASQLEAFSQTLNEQGIAVYVTNPKSIEEVFSNMRRLADLFDMIPEAEKTIAQLRDRADLIREVAPVKDRPRVFVQISREPLFTIGAESFLTTLIEQAGGQSVTKDVATAYPKLSKETAAALDPDVILLSDSEDNREPSAAFKDSKAVSNGRVYRINADIISRPGPRLVDALEEITSRLRGKG